MKRKPAPTYSVNIGGETLPLSIRTIATSRRMVIRYQPLRHALSLTLPRHASIRQGLRFVEERRGWILQQLQAQPQSITLCAGQTIHVLGEPYTLAHSGRMRGTTFTEDGILTISGDPACMERRARDWLKARLLAEVEALAHPMAAQIGKRVHKIALRDTSSRWGSCSTDGHLSFSWRLVFAPYEVMRYVVAHEVSHLAEMNHSPAFWQVVAVLDADWRAHRNWLRAHGKELYQYS